MFCGKCGAKNDDTAVFCGECGAKLNDAPVAATSTPTSEPTPAATTSATTTSTADSAKYKKVGIITVVAVVVVIALFLFGGGNGSKSPEAVADKFMAGFIEADGQAIVDSIPDALLKEALNSNDISEKEAAQKMTTMIAESYSNFDSFLGDNWSLSYKIIGVEDYDASMAASLIESYQSNYGVKVAAVKTVYIELAITSGSFNETSNISLRVIKVDGSWYLDVDALGSLF